MNRRDATGRPTYAIGSDWRKSLLTTAEVVYKQLQGQGVTGEFDLVTHSMGGLLSRVMLSKFRDLEKRVRRVVHICQPCLGAPVMYRRMFTGGDINIDGSSFINRVFFRILGNCGPKFRTNVCGMPGAIQLLPADNYRYQDRIIGGLDAPLLPVYLGPVHPPGLCPAGTSAYVALCMTASLNEFAALRTAIQNSYYANAWYIVGSSLDTDVHVNIAKDKVDAVRHTDGDGTVPVASAFDPDLRPQLLADMLNNASEHRVGIANVEHVAAPADASVIDATMQLLQV